MQHAGSKRTQQPVVVCTHPCDAGKQLAHVRRHHCGAPALAQDLKQVVIAKEVEPVVVCGVLCVVDWSS